MGRKAFTLIELLVVIAIIAVLAALLFPVFSQAKAASKQTVCLSNIKQMSYGITLYENDNDDHYPMGGWENDETGGSSRWYFDIQPYTSRVRLRTCPESGYPIRNDTFYQSDYGINASVGLYGAGASGSQMHQPANLVLLCDTVQYEYKVFPTTPDVLDPTKWFPHAVGNTDYQVEGPYLFNPYTGYPYTETPNAVGNQLKRPYAVHHGMVDVGFCDGHAKAMPIDALVGPMPMGFALTDSRNVWANP